MLPRKIIFYDRITRSVLFVEKVVLCYICKTRHMLGENCLLITTPTQKNSGMSLIEQGDTSHQVNQISVQPEPPAVIHPNSGSQLDTPTLTEETDKGSSLRKSLVWILTQGHTQIHTLALIPGRNLLLSLIFLRGNLPSCLSKITCLRVERIRLLQKRLLLRRQSRICL